MLDKKYVRSIRAALADKGLDEMKESLVAQYTKNRTTHITEMSTHEALALLAKLNESSSQADQRSKMIRLVYSLCYKLGLVDESGELDKKRMAGLVERLSPWHKGLQAHNFEELKTLCTVFRKYYREETKNKPEHEEVQA